jgi:hypothetical protein
VSVLLATVHVEQLEDVLLLVLDAHGDEDQVLPRVRGDHLPSITASDFYKKINNFDVWHKILKTKKIKDLSIKNSFLQY